MWQAVLMLCGVVNGQCLDAEARLPPVWTEAGCINQVEILSEAPQRFIPGFGPVRLTGQCVQTGEEIA